jgi:hypothetical protein
MGTRLRRSAKQHSMGRAKAGPHNTHHFVHVGVTAAVPPPAPPSPTPAAPELLDRPEHQALYTHLLDMHAKQAEALHKVVMLLAGGALGLSITFLEKIAQPPIVAGWSLVGSWSLLVVSLATVSVCIILSLGLIERTLNSFRQVLEGKFKPGRSAKAVPILNWVAVAAMVLGFSGLAFFAFQNFTKKEQHGNPQNQPDRPDASAARPTGHLHPKPAGAPEPRHSDAGPDVRALATSSAGNSSAVDSGDPVDSGAGADATTE